jgi:hypothetical protein
MDARTIPILACRRLDDVLPFYQALGFTQTYRQARPNPYLAVQRGSVDLHFAGVEGYDPATSLGSVIIVVAEPPALFDEFAAGLRAAYGKLPVTGIPRITRPRRKQGTAPGFAVVDPGGNWLRVTADRAGDAPDGRLARALANAARQGDARGDVDAAIAVLDSALARHPDAPAVERVPVLAYLAELLGRAGDRERAARTLADLRALPLDDAERVAVAGDLAAVAEIEGDLI